MVLQSLLLSVTHQAKLTHTYTMVIDLDWADFVKLLVVLFLVTTP